MNKNQLIPGKLYNVQISNKTYKLYFLEIAEEYDHACDCCGKDTMSGYIFCEEFYGVYDENNSELYEKSWDSGVYFVGGSVCLKKFVNEI